MHLQIVNFILLVSQYFCDNRNEIIKKKNKAKLLYDKN